MKHYEFTEAIDKLDKQSDELLNEFNGIRHSVVQVVVELREFALNELYQRRSPRESPRDAVHLERISEWTERLQCAILSLEPNLMKYFDCQKKMVKQARSITDKEVSHEDENEGCKKKELDMPSVPNVATWAVEVEPEKTDTFASVDSRLTNQLKLPEVQTLISTLEPGALVWLKDNNANYRVFYKFALGPPRFFVASCTDEIKRPKFQKNAAIDFLPNRMTLKVFLGPEFDVKTENRWMVVQLDKTIEHSLVSSQILKTPKEEWEDCNPKTIKVDYKGCKEVSIQHLVNTTIFGSSKQKFEINLSVAQLQGNPSLDHSTLILGKDFLLKYLVGLDFLELKKDSEKPTSSKVRAVSPTYFQGLIARSLARPRGPLPKFFS